MTTDGLGGLLAWARRMGVGRPGASADPTDPSGHRRRTQLHLALFALVSLLLLLATEVVARPGGPDPRATVPFVGALTLAATVPLLQLLRAPSWVTGVLVSALVYAFGFGAAALSGGITSVAAFWMPMTPLVAYVTTGPRWAVVWGVAAAVGLVGLTFVPDLGAGPMAIDLAIGPAGGRLVHLFAVAGVLFWISSSWDAAHQDALLRLRGARDEARSADQAKSNLVAVVSHELRTPMNGVLGMLDLMRDTPLDEHQTRLADTARGAARSLLDILDDLLDRSRLDAGRLGLDEVRFRPSEVLASVQHLVDLGGFGRVVPVHFELGDALNWAVTGDPRRLRQVLTNLVGNALKFTEEGEVVVRAWAEPAGDRLRLHLEVSDTGIGIPEDKLPSVFEAFTQADGSVTRRYGGTGLGLAITRDLVQMMGGEIEVQSELGEGSTFRVQIPFAITGESTVDDSGDATEPRVGFGDIRVLVAEDNAVNQMVIKGYLQRHGIQPTVVEDGEAAVFAALERPFDLVLMDCEMPVMDGFRAARALRDQGFQGGIVALTAHASAKVKQQCVESGMDGFLSKPLSPGALIKVLLRFQPLAATPASLR